VTLDIPGAVAAEGVDAPVAGHYGDPLREQRTLLDEVGFVDRSHRGVIAVTGPDRLSWLHSLTSQHLEALPPWQPTEALVLSPHGHVEHHLQVLDDGTTTWLDVEPGTAEALVGYLTSMIFMTRVEVHDVTADWAVLSIVGPDTGKVLTELGLPPVTDTAAALPAGGWVRPMTWPGAAAADLLVPRDQLAGYASRLAKVAKTAGIWAYEALRVEARRPRLNFETDHRTIVQEVGWIPAAVHLDKGCYRGQETVARVQNLGQPPRRLVLLHLDGTVEEVPPHGTPITREDGRQVGFVGTAVRHADLGAVALALVKRNVGGGVTLRAGEMAAAIDPEDAAVPEKELPGVLRSFRR
jgi:tRNA-modifying protein YgfZ